MFQFSVTCFQHYISFRKAFLSGVYLCGELLNVCCILSLHTSVVNLLSNLDRILLSW